MKALEARRITEQNQLSLTDALDTIATKPNVGLKYACSQIYIKTLFIGS